MDRDLTTTLTTVLTTIGTALPTPLTTDQVDAAATLLALFVPTGGELPARLMTDADLARVVGVPAARVPQWRRRYQWPCTRIGRAVRYTAQDVADILALHRELPERPSATEWPLAGGLPGQTPRSVAAWARRSF